MLWWLSGFTKLFHPSLLSKGHEYQDFLPSLSCLLLPNDVSTVPPRKTQHSRPLGEETVNLFTCCFSNVFALQWNLGFGRVPRETGLHRSQITLFGKVQAFDSTKCFPTHFVPKFGAFCHFCSFFSSFQHNSRCFESRIAKILSDEGSSKWIKVILFVQIRLFETSTRDRQRKKIGKSNFTWVPQGIRVTGFQRVSRSRTRWISELSLIFF